MDFNLFKKRFLQQNYNRGELTRQIKFHFVNFKELLQFVDNFEKKLSTAKPLLWRTIIGNNSLPKSYSELNNERHKEYFTGELNKELNWIAISLIKKKDDVNNFIKLKEQFEHYFFLGQYEEAVILLDKIESEICVSCWSLENRFLLNEFEAGSEKNWELRTSIIDTKNEDYIRAIGSMYSAKAEQRVSIFQYNEMFNDWEEKQGLVLNTGYNEIIEWFRFRCHYFSLNRYDHYEEILYRSHGLSIIDKYTIFIKIAHHLITQNNDESTNLITLLINLDKNIDNPLFKIGLSFLDENFQYETEEKTSNILSIFDLYTTGAYRKAIDASKFFLLKEHSCTPELIDIYVKSLIEEGAEYEELTTSSSLLNQFTKDIFNVLSKNEETNQSLINLLNFSLKFDNSKIGMYLYSFIHKELGWESQTNYTFLSILNSDFINPKLINYLYREEDKAIRLQKKLNALFQNSSTISLYNTLTNILVRKNNINITEPIPIAKQKVYTIRLLLEKELYLDCIKECKELLVKNQISPISSYEIVSILYECLLKTQDYISCLNLFVDTFLWNEFFIKKMDSLILTEKILQSNFKLLQSQHTINLPIYTHINQVEKIRVKQSYELFLRNYNCKKPSDLFTLKDEFPLNQLIFFLKEVCSIDVMQLSRIFKSSHQVNEERINICQLLRTIDTENQKAYNSEIAILTQKNIISTVIGKIDEGKIYVNEVKIKKEILNPEVKSEKNKLNKSLDYDTFLTQDFFNRTVDLKKYEDNNQEKNQIILLSPDKEGNYKSNFNSAFDDFRKMFIEIRNKFLFDKENGLDAYLSTRIRHGTLVNHIRSVFEEFHLITTKIDGSYFNNDYWADLSLDNEQKIKIQESLAIFSNRIDEISLMIKDDLIQCKTEEHPAKADALFDYSYKDDMELVILYLKETKGYEDFVNLCFFELWKRTDKCLLNIQSELDSKLKTLFIDYINELEESLNIITNKKELSELSNNIKKCRTEIQIKLGNISKWFKRSESSFDGEYELRVLADTSIQISKNIHPNYQFEINKNICSNFKIKGEYHQHFIDLMNNCLFNIIEHSKLPCEEWNALITANIIDDNLILCFENCVSNPSEHLKKLKNVKENWKKLGSNIRITKEGGTGFPKIKKIINSDLNRMYSNFDFKFEVNKLTIKLVFETKGLKA